MKKMVVITLLSNVAEFYCKQIVEIFGDNIIVEAMAIEDTIFNSSIEADIVLISTRSLFETVKEYVVDIKDILYARMSLSKHGYRVLETIPKNSKALLVNNTGESALDTISLIHQLGFRDLELKPYVPGAPIAEHYDVAITPNEEKLVPENIEKIYNIDDRVLNIATLMDISICLGLDDYFKRTDILNKVSDIVPLSHGFRKVMTESLSIGGQLDVLFKYMSEGIISTNKGQVISNVNDQAANYLNLNGEAIIGNELESIWPALPISNVLKEDEPLNNKLVKYKGIPYVVDIYPINSMKGNNGLLCIFKSFIESERKQHKLREQISDKGHSAYYTFNDIVGNSKIITQLRNRAGNMAQSDASILIFGESGTGKELFAQAMHNESKRNQGPFVAINCAALPESLLESELFGYEEGAFTGAKRGGKIGLFEMAHGGTLFLDELGEMPLRLQSRLLRVIQERKVMRLGGEYLIDIDVRIIAATNKNLRSMMKQNEFRQDLYYRLNVLSIKVPPLRERVEDIPCIIQSILKSLGKDLIVQNEVYDYLFKYSWEGNIRELHNCVEYMCFSGNSYATVHDIPGYILDEMQNKVLHVNSDIKDLHEICIEDHERLVFNCIRDAYKLQTRIGRRQIFSTLKSNGLLISENEIRKHINTLEDKGLVEVKKGRAGTVITSKGLNFKWE